jgi:hypothetical protein
VNYLDDIAGRIREQVPKDLLPEGDTTALFRNYAVLALAMGPRVRLSDVHNAWVAWMLDLRPDHAAAVPFDELPPDVQRQDAPFANAIQRVVSELSSSLRPPPPEGGQAWPNTTSS